MSINSEDLLVNQRNKGTSERESIIMIKKKREKTTFSNLNAHRTQIQYSITGNECISKSHDINFMTKKN